MAVTKNNVKRRLTWNDVMPFPDNPIYLGRLDQMRREWGGYNHKIVGSPAIFENNGAFPEFPEDALLVGDGNHRLALAREDRATENEFLADLYRGLSREEMFKIRRGLNDRRTVKPAERFLSLAEENGRSTQRQIKRAVEGLGWKVTFDRCDGGLPCTNELEWIWARDRQALNRAIQSYEAVWGTKAARSQARVVKGLGAFWIKYPDADADRLHESLEGVTVDDLYLAGKSQTEALPFIKSVFDGIRYVLAQGYNKRLRNGARKLVI